MCTMWLVQLLSLSSSPTLLYTALCFWDSANYISSLPVGFPLGSASQCGVLNGEAAELEGREELVPSCLLLSGISTSALVPDMIVYLRGLFVCF